MAIEDIPFAVELGDALCPRCRRPDGDAGLLDLFGRDRAEDMMLVAAQAEAQRLDLAQILRQLPLIAGALAPEVDGDDPQPVEGVEQHGSDQADLHEVHEWVLVCIDHPVVGLGGDADERDILGWANGSVPLNDEGTANFYLFGGASRRDGVHGGNYRRALQTQNWPQIYPLGFLPLIEPKIVDYSGTLGLRGVMGGSWFWDLSAQYGQFERNRCMI